MKRLIALLFLLMAVATSYAQSRTMMGMPDCGEWFNSRDSKMWLAGYLSGVNANEKDSDIIRGVSSDQVFLWMDNYCRANPLNTVQQGANQLVRELRARATKP